MEGAEVGYLPGRPILRRLDLRLDEDDRIALLGSNGNGKSTLAKLLAGRMEASGGVFRRAAGLSVGYFAQHQLDEVDPRRSAYDHLRGLMPGEPEARVRARAGTLGFPAAMMDTPAGELSGGERARLLLGLLAFHRPHLLILDEPTNHLDIDSREALVQALNDYSGAIVIISHDRFLLEAVADRLWLVAGGTVRPFEGDLDEYRATVLGERGASGKGAATGGNGVRDRRREGALRRERTAPLRRKVEEIEARMAELNRKIAQLDRVLADASLYEEDQERAVELGKERAAAARALADAEEAWLAASSTYEQAV
jgi:ATP-binding cassette subfamily F protein 3